MGKLSNQNISKNIHCMLSGTRTNSLRDRYRQLDERVKHMSTLFMLWPKSKKNVYSKFSPVLESNVICF